MRPVLTIRHTRSDAPGRRVAAALIALGLAAQGCSSAAPTGTPTAAIASTATSGSTASPSALASAPATLGPPNPLDVAVQVDPARAVSATIPIEGGVIMATTSSGIQLSLKIPAGDLSAPTEVSITPVTSIDPAPFSGGVLAGIQVAPEGLRLLEPADLAFAGAPVSGDLVGFAYRDTGTELHLFPTAVDGSLVHLAISHFSGYGVASATSADRAAMAQHAPSTPEARSEQELGGLASGTLRPAVQATLAGVAAVMCIEFDEAVFTTLRAAETGQESAIDPAIVQFLNWLRRTMLAGIYDSGFPRAQQPKQPYTDPCVIARVGRGFDALKKALQASIDRAERRCTDTDDAGHFATMMHRERQGELLGVFDPGEADVVWQRGVKSCLTFQLRIDSTITFDTSVDTPEGNTEKLVMHVVSAVNLDYEGAGSGGEVEPECGATFTFPVPGPSDPAAAPAPEGSRTICLYDLLSGSDSPRYAHRPGASYRGHGQLVYESATTTLKTYGACSTITVTTSGAPVTVIALISINGPGLPADVNLGVVPDTPPSETGTQTCAGRAFTNHTQNWYDYYLRLHGSHHFMWTEWQSPGSEAYAVATDNVANSWGGGVATENLSLKLVHCRNGSCPAK